MSVEGIWTSEVYGAFGWENHGVFVLETGRILGGDSRQYSVGHYIVSDEKVIAELKVHYYGPPRTVFGEAREEFAIKIEGTLKDGVIDGTICRPDRPQFDLQFRMTKRLNVPTPPTPPSA